MKRLHMRNMHVCLAQRNWILVALESRKLNQEIVCKEEKYWKESSKILARITYVYENNYGLVLLCAYLRSVLLAGKLIQLSVSSFLT